MREMKPTRFLLLSGWPAACLPATHTAHLASVCSTHPSRPPGDPQPSQPSQRPPLPPPTPQKNRGGTHAHTSKKTCCNTPACATTETH